ncbi:hypothetical protein BE20_14615 [Sorangium cellulosum]|nr:hypothetical protein BE20_14615 [Sorangium cellulosum]
MGQPMRVARYNHTATWLESGEVLVLGGQRNNLNAPAVEPVDTVEAYDPETDTWTPRASMATSRAYHTATLLPDGEVLVTGGMAGIRTLSSAELYDPRTDTPPRRR